MREFAGQARFVVENYGASELAKRFGVTRYPAIFVDDVLVATPRDFGFYGQGEGKGDGRYTPWKSAGSHERFRADLSRAVRLALDGGKAEARQGETSAAGREAGTLPDLRLVDLDGRRVTREELAGRVVVVDFWATWCPPCRGTLRWLGELKKKHPDRLAVLAVAVESDEAAVRKVAEQLGAPLTWAMGSPEIARAFGDVGAVPTLFVFDARGRAAATFYGSPPSLHAEAEERLAALLAPR